MAAPSPLQFAYRTQKTIGLFDADPVYEPLPNFAKPEGNLRCCAYSPCGRLFGWASPEAVSVVDTATGQPLTVLPLPNVLELGFSPHGTFLITWERPSKDEAGDATKNLKVWRAVEEGVDPSEKQPLGKWVQKSQGGWNLQYTADERYCARMVTNEVQFHESHTLASVWDKLRVEGVADFALAPGPTNAVAVFIPERKGQPAAVKVFHVPRFDAPVSQKNFYKGDKVQLKWNDQGTALLVLAQTDVDKTNKSYYGETTLYLLSTAGGFDSRVPLDKEGPIHDVSWSPNSKEFGVVYGYMPAKTTIFDHRAVVTHSFPIGPRNTIIFSPTGRFALVAGFGNLAGQIDAYDLERDFAKICTIESGNPSVCQWSPDSRYILTATTSPRLRVDNGVKIWHVSGALMYNEDMVELYSVLWRPAAAAAAAGVVENGSGSDPLSPVPAPHQSAATYLGKLKAPAKAVGAYRPPGARGLATPLHFKREDEGGAAHTVGNGVFGSGGGTNGFGRGGGGGGGGGLGRRTVPGAESIDSGTRGVPGAEGVGDDDASRAASKNKKKRNRKKDGEGKLFPEASGGASLAPTPLPPTTDTADSGGGGRDSHRAERRGQGHGGQSGRNNRSVSRNNGNRKVRGPHHAGVQPQQQQDGVAEHDHHDQHDHADGPDEAAAAINSAPQNPNAKKIRSLTKKVRAIEDLEMRLAGGEKLEDTQMKKMATKAAVQRELEELERSHPGPAGSSPDMGGGF